LLYSQSQGNRGQELLDDRRKGRARTNKSKVCLYHTAINECAFIPRWLTSCLLRREPSKVAKALFDTLAELSKSKVLALALALELALALNVFGSLGKFYNKHTIIF
jgi:hypothetical protein